MAYSRLSVARFYEKEPEAYWALSRDRDFDAQIAAAVSLLGNEPRAVADLFAGPAYHGAALRRRFAACDVVAIDASPAMRDVAARFEGFPAENYFVSPLGEGRTWPVRSPLCMALILRYSIGYLDDDQFITFLSTVHDALRPGGLVLIELHSIPLLFGGLQDLGIKSRTVEIDGRRITCEWPDGPLMWRSDSWTVEMPLTVSWAEKTGALRDEKYLSIERIYSEREIVVAASRCFGLEQVEIGETERAAFPDGELVCLRRPDA
ncbi:MAG: class I SAM-dependent methyltransferase [Nitrobacter sp.]|uniref:class I SAM-dependent methyltransferase n=1 Tax=Nitrobacter sp. TaxID=29420 RepID=UPI00260A353B|nr:class I SAM-dependent methyltransferase [Nitrobacter sp.]MCV0387939.1 class I SAM-dependent methyltransferase [Nitrobacter sp.]